MFQPAYTVNSHKKKLTAVEELVRSANEEDVRSFLTAVLAEDEKLLLRFHNIINKQVTREDINNYIRQVDIIADRYLGRNHFISYYEADGFISELEEIIDEDVRRMIDNGDYLSAFEVMYYIFVLIGDVMQSLNGLIMIVNSFVFVICATALSFFIGSLIKNKNIIGGIVNVVALGSSFLCGAFVPTQWLPDFVKTIAHILPTYYYINVNDTLSELEELNFDTLMPIFINMGIVLGFAVVFIVLANLVARKKRKIG